MGDVSDEELLALVRSALSPVLSAAGFTEGSGGWDGFVFSCPTTDFAERFPWLSVGLDDSRGWMASVDVTIEFDQYTGRLGATHLEGSSLAASLHAHGRGDLAALLKAARSLDLSEALGVVAEALDALFTEPGHGQEPSRRRTAGPVRGAERSPEHGSQVPDGDWEAC